MTCALCMRAVFEVEGDAEPVYKHWDARIDMPECPAFHIPELYVAPKVNWGHLNDPRKLMEVKA